MNGNPVRIRAAKESFLLLDPDLKKNSHEIAKAIASCRGVKRVFVTSGEFGFVVSTEDRGDGTGRASRSIKKLLGGKGSKVVKGHYVYSVKSRT
ncbi:MAG: hypothetical protein KGI04_00120 [Candidatus Micrarchaeota archaeon]|nr:hypothetical protein [Candidatus Micrarchaeota archaeon]